MPTAQPLPKPEFFLHPALLATAEATGFQPGKMVRFKVIYDLVVAKTGLGDADPAELYDRVCRTVRWHRRAKRPLFIKGGWGMWGLTDAGLEEARKLAPQPKPKKPPKNITSEFIERRLKATGGINGPLWNLFRTTLRAHLTISDTTDRIEEHIQEAMLRLIRRDALRERLMDGQSIEDTQLSSYILRSAYNDCRDEGTEPTSRELYGALTERERRNGIKRGPVTDPRVIWKRDSDKWDTAMIVEIRDTEGSGTNEAVIDAIYFEECWQKIEAIIKAKKPHAWKRYLAVLKLRAEGARVKEIAEIEKVSPYRAASIISEVRRVVREAKDGDLLNFLY